VTEHPGPLLSALADGNLADHERAAVEAHVSGCEPCRRELRAVTLLREAVAALPPVEPPDWFLPGVLADGPQPRDRRTRRLRFGVANVAATAAAWLVVVGATTHAAVPAAAPDLAGLVAAHREAAGQPLAANGSQPMSAPPSLGSGYALAGVREVDGVGQAVYRSGDRWLSLFAQPGRLDRSAVPAGAQRVEVAGEPAWEVAEGDRQVVVVDRGDATLVLVGGPGTDAVAVPAALEVQQPSDGIVDRVVEAGTGLLRAFSLGG
jgi:hypothetical protein